MYLHHQLVEMEYCSEESFTVRFCCLFFLNEEGVTSLY